jgi:hypothetical protein
MIQKLERGMVKESKKFEEVNVYKYAGVRVGNGWLWVQHEGRNVDGGDGG